MDDQHLPLDNVDFRLLDNLMARMLADAQAEMDQLHLAYAGRPAAQVQLGIRGAMARTGWDLDDDVVQEYAALIEDGVRVEL